MPGAFDWAALAPEALCGVEALSGGRNSQVVRLLGAGGGSWIGKRYFRHPSDLRDRMGTEVRALRAMAAGGIDCVPRLLSCFEEQGAVLLEDCGCEQVKNPTLAEAGALADWVVSLQSLKGSDVFPTASEACFCTEEIFDNLHARWERLVQISNDYRSVCLLHAFLRGPFEQHLSRARLLALAPEAGLDPGQVLPEEQRILSPSDFGFHNACRRPDGRLAFFDLEYFGWDDPAKALCDFALHRHPLMQVGSGVRRQVLETLAAGLPGGRGLRLRCLALYRLFRLKWALIMLNEFHPVDAARRLFAGEDPEREARLIERLAGVEDFLQHTERDYEEFRRCLA